MASLFKRKAMSQKMDFWLPLRVHYATTGSHVESNTITSYVPAAAGSNKNVMIIELDEQYFKHEEAKKELIQEFGMKKVD